jgi:hypothetical protein
VGKWKTCFGFPLFHPPSSSKLWELWESRPPLARFPRGSWKEGEACLWLSTLSTAPAFPQLCVGFVGSRRTFQERDRHSGMAECGRGLQQGKSCRPYLGSSWSRTLATARPATQACLAPFAVSAVFRSASPGYRSSLLSRISSLNCHPSKLINMRPNSCQGISRPSTFSCGTEPSWESSHSIFPRTTR